MIKPQTSNLKVKLGFTLIELLVVISIFTIITSVIIFNESKFSSNILITNLSYQVALAIRQAQVSGIGVKASTASQSSGGYGVHFNLGQKSSFILFSDSPVGTIPSNGIAKGNGVYDALDTVLNTYYIQKENMIENLYTVSQSGALTPMQNLDITFVRPNPDATINGVSTSGGSVKGASEAEIVLETSLHDKCRVVTVGISGDISVPIITTTNPQCTP